LGSIQLGRYKYRRGDKSGRDNQSIGGGNDTELEGFAEGYG